MMNKKIIAGIITGCSIMAIQANANAAAVFLNVCLAPPECFTSDYEPLCEGVRPGEVRDVLFDKMADVFSVKDVCPQAHVRVEVERRRIPIPPRL